MAFSTVLSASAASPFLLPLLTTSTYNPIPLLLIPRKTPIKDVLVHRRRTSRTLIEASSRNQTKTAAAASEAAGVPVEEEESTSSIDSASGIVRNFYGGINNHDLASVEELIAEKCVYEDLIFPQPFVGRKAILEFFKKFTDSISKDLQFVIDDISNKDSLAVGVTWHLEWQGRPFPFSRGCSFYRLEIVNGKKQIIYGRDSVEPSVKPGETALVAIRAVTWLLQRFPQLAEQLR